MAKSATCFVLSSLAVTVAEEVMREWGFHLGSAVENGLDREGGIRTVTLAKGSTVSSGSYPSPTALMIFCETEDRREVINAGQRLGHAIGYVLLIRQMEQILAQNSEHSLPRVIVQSPSYHARLNSPLGRRSLFDPPIPMV